MSDTGSGTHNSIRRELENIHKQTSLADSGLRKLLRLHNEVLLCGSMCIPYTLRSSLFLLLLLCFAVLRLTLTRKQRDRYGKEISQINLGKKAFMGGRATYNVCPCCTVCMCLCVSVCESSFRRSGMIFNVFIYLFFRSLFFSSIPSSLLAFLS